MASTETPTIVPSAWKIWVMPSFRPMSPMLIGRSPARHDEARSAQGAREHAHERTCRCVSERVERATRRWAAWSWCASHLDFDVDTGGEAESHQGVDRLRARIQDVDEPLVGADLELLPAVLVDERRPQDGELLDARRQRHGTDDIRAGPLGRLHDLGRRQIEQAVVVGLE